MFPEECRLRTNAWHLSEGVTQTNLNGIATDLSTKVLIDNFQRPINSVRISINRECNLGCFYCHNEGMPVDKRSVDPEGFERFAAIASDLGIRKVKITGGEPLMRDDVVEIIGLIAPYFDEVSMTTNAVRLAPLALPLKKAGLDRVNITLNSLRPDRYTRISGSDHLSEAIAGIDSAIETGLTPVKLNMVFLKGINDDEVPQMMEFAASKGAILQLIELEIEKERLSTDTYSFYHKDLTDTLDWVRSIGRENGKNCLHNRERYIVERIPGGPSLPGPVVVEFVMPMHNHSFCANCTRIRFTAGGYVKGCLFDKSIVGDFLGHVNDGAQDHQLKDLILGIVDDRKPYWTDTD
jgi:cyclic pyranopterin phosphate synthase